MRLKIIFLVIFLPLIIGTATGGYLAVARGTPSISELKNYRKTPGTRVYADDGALIGELRVEKGIYMPFEKMPGHLINAVIAVEDSHFWKHKGIDYLALIRAAAKDILSGRIKEGGSTITQQLAKITFLTPEKTFKRKIKEAALAIKIEKGLSKKEILDLYLNRVYFGHGVNGVEMAARIYFGKPAGELKVHEAALLAGLLKAPSTYSPFNDIKKAKQRQLIALLRMEEEGYITPKQREEAAKKPIYLSARINEQEAYSYFIDYLKDYLEKKYGIEKVLKGDMKVYTTVDRQALFAAQLALKEGLRELDKRKGWRGAVDHREPGAGDEMEDGKFTLSAIGVGDIMTGVVLEVKKNEARIKARGITGRLPLENAKWAAYMQDPKTRRIRYIEKFALEKILTRGDEIKVRVSSVAGGKVTFSLEQDPEVEGALIAIDPKTGYIRAMVGGYDYRKSEFNRAVYAKRQPGSAFKPIVYALAMEHGFTPSTVIVDEPVSYNTGSAEPWTPKNYDGKYLGPTALRTALALSRNVVTVKLVEKMGIDSVIEFAKRLGIASDIPRNLSIALGSISVTPLNLAYTYGVFANGGAKTKPIAVKYITDSKGRIIESNEPEGQEVISAEVSYLITSMLRDVVEHGTGWRAKALGRPAAGKTGTTNDYKDAWFVGYTTDLLAAVWVGYDDLRPLGSGETGAKAASPIWVSFMKAVSSEGAPEDFPLPPSPEGADIFFVEPGKNAEAEKLRHPEGAKPPETQGEKPEQVPYPPIWEGDEKPDFD